MQLEPKKKGRRLHILSVPALPRRKKVVAKKVKSHPCIDHTSQLPLPEFGNQGEAEDANLVKPFEGKAKGKAVASHDQVKASKKDGRSAQAEERMRQIAEILLGGIYRYSQSKGFISDNSLEEMQNGGTPTEETSIIESKPKARKS